MSREQYKGIHGVVNDQGLAMHYRASSNMASIQQSQRMDLLHLLCQEVLEANIVQYGFLEHKVCKNNRY